MTARKAYIAEVVRSIAEGGGSVQEADEAVNNAARRVIQEMFAAGGCWLGKLNPYRIEKGPVMWSYDGGKLWNFCCDFVIPRYDGELEQLIRRRNDTPYEGTAKDLALLNPILDRIEKVGGVHLIWT